MDEFSKELEEMGHVKVAHSRCAARYKMEPQRVPGPPTLPVWCDLPAGHEGPHRHVTGHRSFIMDRAHLIEMVPLPKVCQSCGTVWPCKEAEKLTHAYSLGLAKGRKEGMEDKPSGWLITGSRIYADAAVTSEGMADRRIAERNDGASYKVPLYAIRQAAQGGEGEE